MGLGKTLQTIAIIYTMLTQGPTGGAAATNAIVICPTSLCLNWANECERWLPKMLEPVVLTSDAKKDLVQMRLQSFLSASGRRSGKGALLIISYETASIHIETLRRGAFGLIVCDEAHRLKNPKTKLYKALQPLRSNMRIMVTGTPIQVFHSCAAR